jgi:hypothetical protein
MFLSQTREILKNKMIEKWGVDSYFKTLKFKESKLYDLFSDEKYRKDNFIISKNANYIRYLGNNLSEFNCDRNLNHNFVINSDVFFSRKSKYLVSGKRINKQQFTKSKLKKRLIDTTGSENSITKSMGIYKIYNCGKLKFQLLLN